LCLQPKTLFPNSQDAIVLDAECAIPTFLGDNRKEAKLFFDCLLDLIKESKEYKGLFHILVLRIPLIGADNCFEIASNYLGANAINQTVELDEGERCCVVILNSPTGNIHNSTYLSNIDKFGILHSNSLCRFVESMCKHISHKSETYIGSLEVEKAQKIVDLIKEYISKGCHWQPRYLTDKILLVDEKHDAHSNLRELSQEDLRDIFDSDFFMSYNYNIARLPGGSFL